MQPLRYIAGLALALTLSFSAFAAQGTGRVTIPLSIDDSDRMSVWVEVGGEQSLAVIDTAATYPMVDSHLLNTENSEPTGAEVRVIGVGGKRLFDETEVGPVKVGDTQFAKVSAAINGRANFPGHRTVLPTITFDARILDFDFPLGRLDIYNSRPDRMGDHVLSRLPYTTIGGLPFIQVKVNGVKGLALIDTGSDVSYLNSVFAEQAGAVLKLDRTTELFGAAGEDSSTVKIMQVKKLNFGRHSKRKFEMLSADTPIFAHLGLQNEAVMVMGLDTLRHFRMQIDREAGRVYLGRPESEHEGRRYRISPFSGRVRKAVTG
jgi:hypothetical protein